MLNTPIKEDALVVLSGGQDSTTCLFWALKTFQRVEAVCFAYGQRHEAEVKVAEEICREANVPFRLIQADFIGALSKNSLTTLEMPVDEKKPEGTPPNTFVPGRNLFFLAMAAVVAREKGIRHLVTGVGQTDFSGYPDCRDSFIKSLNVSLNLAMEEQFEIHTPLMWKNKCETWALADDLGVLELVRNRTLTCYNGIAGDGCGHCPACQLRREGLEQYLTQRGAK